MPTKKKKRILPVIIEIFSWVQKMDELESIMAQMLTLQKQQQELQLQQQKDQYKQQETTRITITTTKGQIGATIPTKETTMFFEENNRRKNVWFILARRYHEFHWWIYLWFWRGDNFSVVL